MENLDLAIITLAGVALAACVTWLIAQRRIVVQHVTAERAKWRETIRELTLRVHDAIRYGKRERLERLICEFRVLLNPFDADDRAILDCMDVGGPDELGADRADEFAKRISLLLKHDWDRAKLEAGFFLARWLLKAKRWPLTWDAGKSGKRRKRKGLRWWEKYEIRPLRTLLLLVIAISLTLIVYTRARMDDSGLPDARTSAERSQLD